MTQAIPIDRGAPYPQEDPEDARATWARRDDAPGRGGCYRRRREPPG